MIGRTRWDLPWENALINSEPRHGYGIMQHVDELSQGRVKLAAGTLYGALNSLLEKGWIEALPEEKDSRKKEYQITDEGRKVLQTEITRLQELLSNGLRLTDVSQ